MPVSPLYYYLKINHLPGKKEKELKKEKKEFGGPSFFSNYSISFSFYSLKAENICPKSMAAKHRSPNAKTPKLTKRQPLQSIHQKIPCNLIFLAIEVAYLKIRNGLDILYK